MDLSELQARGWTLVEGISSQAELLDLGRALGTPVPAPNGELVKEVRRIPAHEAPVGTQSSLYGDGRFPLHTDTVFWPTPVRYVLLRAYGDIRRPTTVGSFEALARSCDQRLVSLMYESVWCVGVSGRCFYCSLRFRAGDSRGWRYDADLMSPANEAAEVVHSVLQQVVRADTVPTIDWSESTAAVICNWTALHGRGPQPQDEGDRIIERLYVR